MSGQQIYFEDFSDSQFDPSTSSRNALYPAQASTKVQKGADTPPREERDVTPTDNPIRRLERQVEQQEEGKEEEEKRKRRKEKERENGHDRDRDKNRKKDKRSPDDSSKKKSRRDSQHESESSRKNSRSYEDKRYHRDRTPEMRSHNQDKHSKDSRSQSRHRNRSERNSQTSNRDNFDNGPAAGSEESFPNTNDIFNKSSGSGGDTNFFGRGWGRGKKADFWEPGMPTTEEAEPTASVRDQFRVVYNYRDQNTVVYGEHDNFFETHNPQNQFSQNKEVERAKRSPTPLQRLEKPTRRRPTLFWDVPPKGYEHITPLQYKAMQAAGQIPTLGGAVVPNANTPTTPTVVTMVDLPPPLPVNFSSNFNSSFSSSSSNQGAVSNLSSSVGAAGSGGTQITAQLARQARRLYVGNIPFGITEDLLLQFFNDKMHQSGLSSGPGNSITTVQVNHDKNFAFLEFRCVDECTNALVFDGTMLQGQNLRVRRPNGYASLLSVVESSKAGTLAQQSFANMQGVGFSQKENPNKLFLGGIPCYLNDGQVQELLLAFGPLQAFNLVKDNVTGASKGYAFCEYMDHSVTDVAIQGLNGMQLGEKKIVVQRASVGAKNAIYAPASDLSQQLGIPCLAPGSQARESKSKILCMLNMVIASELENDQEFEDILEDVRDECGRYGSVISLEIPRPIQGVEVPGVGKIFVEFTSVEDCSSAQMALAGRSFAGRTVVTSYFSEEKYRMKDFG